MIRRSVAFYLILLISCVNCPALEANENLQFEFFTLNETLFSGFGAEFSAVLGALDSYENGEYAGLKIDLNSGLYFDPIAGPNWWEYYFAPICIGEINSNNQHHSTIHESCILSSKAYNSLSRQRNNDLIRKYVHVKSSIQDEVDAFVEENFKGKFVIAVHHRGTDKSSEVSTIPWELTLNVLQNAIKNLSHSNLAKLKIYVATDDQNFLDYMRHYYSAYIVCGNFARSTNNKPLHLYESQYYTNNYEKGKEAIVEALIISRCNALIRPAPSGFSWIPMVFSPNMPVNSINCGGWIYPGKWSPPLKKKEINY